MLDVFSMAVNAVFPIVLLILLGYFLRRRNFISESFTNIGNKLVFQICLPCMLFINVYGIEDLGAVRWDIAVYSVVAALVLFALGFITAIAVTKDPKRRGVLLQCAFRSNFAIIGLTLASSLGGSAAGGVAAVVSAFSIPAFNILAVIALSVFVKDSRKKSGSVGGILLNIVKNPLIISVALGLLCLCLRSLQTRLFGRLVFSLERDVNFLYTAIRNLNAVASPFALIVLGGQFEFSAVRELKKEIIAGTVWRLVLAPAIGIGGALLLGRYTDLLYCGRNELPALIALFGSPVAVSSAVMAKAMDNDGQLATQLVVWTSVFSIVTIFVQICLLM